MKIQRIAMMMKKRRKQTPQVRALTRSLAQRKSRI
jgi:hypothetical protein